MRAVTLALAVAGGLLFLVPGCGGGGGGSGGGAGGAGASTSSGPTSGSTSAGGGSTGGTHSGGSGGQPGTGGSPPGCALTQCGSACVDTSADAAHCGGCGHDCMGAACQEGMCRPTPVLPDAVDATLIALDGDDILFVSYILDNGKETLYREPKSGGAPVKLVTEPGGISQLAAAGGYAYYVTGASSQTTVKRIAKSGGTAEPLITGFSLPVEHLGVTSEGVYFVSDCSTVFRTPLTGGTPQPLTDTSCNVFGTVPFAIDPMGQKSYTVFLGLYGDPLREVSLPSGKSVELLASVGAGDATPKCELVAGPDRVVYTVPSSCTSLGTTPVCTQGTINSVMSDGTGNTTLVDLTPLMPAQGYHPIKSLAIDGGHLYFMLSSGVSEQTMYRVDLDGKNLQKMYVGSGDDLLAVDQSYVYVSEYSWRLSRIPK